MNRVSIDRSLRSYEIKTALITGASSGIGLEFASWLLEAGWRVVAASRTAGSSEDLRRLKAERGDRLLVHRLDVGDKASRRGFFEAVPKEAEGLDLLINAAGIISGDEESASTFGDLDQCELSRTLLINGIAPLMMTEGGLSVAEEGEAPCRRQHLIAQRKHLLVEQAGEVQLVRQQGGVEHDHQDALNRIEGRWDPRHFHPPRLGEDVDDPKRRRSDGAAESISGVVRVIESLRPEDSGKFLDWQGNEVPW